MNKINSKYFWIGYYFGLSCISHQDTGRWTLAGMFNDTVVCEKYEDGKCIDCMYYPISEVSFVLKKINPFLFASVSNLHAFIKTKALDGYWMNFDKSINVIYEG